MTRSVTDEFFWDSVFSPILDSLTENSRTTVGGLGGASLSLAVVSAHRLAGPTIVVAPTVTTAESLRDDIKAVTGTDVLYFPAYETLPFQGEAAHQSVIADRIECLAGLHSARHDTLVVVPARSLVKRLPPADSFRMLSVYRGMRLSPNSLENWLLSAGYIKESSVFEQGRWSRRGGIVDIGTYGNDNPYRIEFFGDEVESVRLFDQHSQRTINRVGTAVILPAREVVLTPGEWNAAADRVPDEHPLEEFMYGASDFPGIEHHLPLFFNSFSTIFDYLAEIGTLILVEPLRLKQVIEETILARKAAFPGDLPFKFSEAYASWKEIETSIARCGRVLEHTLVPSETVDFYLPTEPQTGFMGHRDEMFRQMRQWRDSGFRIAVACDTGAESNSFRELLPEDIRKSVEVPVLSISDGFVMRNSGSAIAFLCERRLLSTRRRPERVRKFRGGETLASWEELQPGNYIVHEAYGIGQFLGLKQLTVADGDVDCLELVYRDGDRLMIPLEQIGQVQKYLTPGGGNPVLDKIGGTAWLKRLSRVKNRAQEIAGRLAILYAERTVRKRPAFPPPGRLSEAMEKSFPYEETPDQAAAINAVMKDFSKDTPMERLICGDVGYGKTEVALRAAFRAAEAGVQVAVLAPTTVLAEQHYNTFRDRLAEFPVKVDVLSRFQSRAEQKKTLTGMSQGDVSIVVGTHRLLQKDVRFNNLGLLIVDEEQRFGVKQKEYLREMKTTVDTLTLTATPIPRTLHMALSGFREISIISTPPRDRYPIQTEITTFNHDIIARAVARELERDGQIFFIHNRISTIEKMKSRLESFLDIDIVVGHGQMSSHQLEDVMHSFMAGKYQMLLSTSIIESGIDLPRVNTMFIDNAQNFGLAELYQLRGRVGRSHHRAYCYMITPGGLGRLKPEGRNRLEAIQRYTRLGSGWHIAMRDLELRGAGEFLGAGQSGQVESVGYSMFEELLAREVSMLKGEKGGLQRPQARIELPGKAFIPEEYMPDTSERVHLYRWVWRAKTQDDVKQWLEYVKDRFGTIPQPVRGVADRAWVNSLAMKSGIEDVVLSSFMARLVFLPGAAPRVQKVRSLAGEGWKVQTEKTGRTVLSRNFRDSLPEERMFALLTVLRIFAQYFENH
ncbi:MAG: transcription-repair coupling factor [Candidatus Fermentibacteraceae bacterium]|nr:transcription-repair coupling factor [Candidatus Fermentibacteraceae bacterium]